jgi:L-alanine-DL-glutamate epimerase-like enolase superfamily enzyme
LFYKGSDLRLKITDIKTFNVYTYRTNYVFVKIETDEGISGIGEGTLEYKEHALLGAIEDLKRVLIGQDPREVERICHELYRDSYWRVGPVLQSAISALNIAMWDIKAKALQVPLYELLGGKVRDSVRMYANVCRCKGAGRVCRCRQKGCGNGRHGPQVGPLWQGISLHGQSGVFPCHRDRGSGACCCGQQRRSADRGAWPL